LASTLKEAEDEEAIGFMDNSLFNLPEDPERNLDFEVHGRKMAAEACVVTVAIFSDLKQRKKLERRVSLVEA
jgi:hypothetical protein